MRAGSTQGHLPAASDFAGERYSENDFREYNVAVEMSPPVRCPRVRYRAGKGPVSRSEKAFLRMLLSAESLKLFETFN